MSTKTAKTQNSTSLHYQIILVAVFCIFNCLHCLAQDTVKINPSLPGNKISPDFTGIAYESDALHFDSLRSGNHTLIQYFKTAGVKTFRLGGNSVENYIFSPTSSSYHPPDTLTTRELDSLFSFASAAGCKIILGMNFGGYFDPTLAGEEASYVMQHYSTQLLAFEIGNEPNLYYLNGLRSPAYNYDSFQVQFLQYVDTIRKYAPAAPISGAAAARKQAELYTTPFAHYMIGKGIINLLTQHNYSIPQGSATGIEIDSLLSHYTIDSIKYTSDTLVMRADSDGVPFQMDECNALYPGGQWGVNNSLAGALWALDYMFTLAHSGVNGVNFHTTYDTNATIINDNSGVYSAKAIYYGILAFQLGGFGHFLPESIIGTPYNLSVYPVVDSVQNIHITLINKDTLNPVSLQLYADSMVYTSGEWISLTASTVSDTSGITLGGNFVSPAGTWTSGPWTPVTASHGYFPLTIPKATALIVELNAPLTGTDKLRTNSEELRVYPNPNNGIFTITFSHAVPNYSGSSSQYTIEVYNTLGEMVFNAPLKPNQTVQPGGQVQDDVQINLSNLSDGIYTIRLTTPTEISVQKVAVMRNR